MKSHCNGNYFLYFQASPSEMEIPYSDEMIIASDVAMLSSPGPIITTRTFRRHAVKNFRKLNKMYMYSRFEQFEKMGLGKRIKRDAQNLYFAKVKPADLTNFNMHDFVIPGLNFQVYERRFYTYVKDMDVLPLQSLEEQLEHLMGREYFDDLINFWKTKNIFTS